MSQQDNQEDPIAMYLIVNEELIEAMEIGKTCAQVGHAVSMLMLQYHKLDKEYERLTMNVGAFNQFERFAEYSLWRDWFKNGIRKIALKADRSEWSKLKTEFKETMVLVCDAGITKLEPGSETVIGLPPQRKSQRSPLLKKLQVL